MTTAGPRIRNLSQKLFDWVGDKCYENLEDSKFNRLI